MFSWLTNPNVLLGGLFLGIIQVVVALPWLRAIDPRGFDRALRNPSLLGQALVPIGLVCLVTIFFLGYFGASASFESYGKYFGAVLHLQLLIDAFVLLPALLTVVWPKGGAVAQAAYREGWRQPMFWLLLVAGAVDRRGRVPAVLHVRRRLQDDEADRVRLRHAVPGPVRRPGREHFD